MLVLTGCAVIDVDIEFAPGTTISNRIIAQDVGQFAHISPLTINDDIKSYLDEVFNHDVIQQEKASLLHKILFDEVCLGIKYGDQATQIAVELFESRSGNCLTVMNLYTAMGLAKVTKEILM